MKHVITLILFSFFLTLTANAQQAAEISLSSKINHWKQINNHIQDKPLKHKYKAQFIVNKHLSSAHRFKSISENKHKLDSIVSIDPNDSFYSFKGTYAYDLNGNNTRATNYDWSTELNSWVGSYQQMYEYNSEEKLTMELQEEWDPSTQSWTGIVKFIHTYENGHLSETVTSWWDDETNGWLEVQKDQYTYDGNSVLEYIISSYLDEGVWVIVWKDEYTYDMNGNNTMILSLAWADTDWFPVEETVFTYNSNGQVLTEILSEYEFGTEVWIPLTKFENIYDSNGNRTEEIFSTWDEERWIGDDKIEHTFDADNNITTQVLAIWESDIDEWINQGKTEFNYNNDYGFNDLYLPYLFYVMMPELFNHMVTDAENFDWDNTNQQWVSTSNDELYYSETIVSSISDNTTDQSSVYPNPATDYIDIKLAGLSSSTIVQIIDLQGKKVMEHVITGNDRLSISNLDRGLYIVQFSQNGKVENHKLVVE